MQDTQSSSVPLLTAMATLIAAGMAAVVTIVVALVNGWFARRLALDAAHRAYRSEHAEAATTATRSFLMKLYEVESAQARGDPGAWVKGVVELIELQEATTDLRVPADETFTVALGFFGYRRREAVDWLRANTTQQTTTTADSFVFPKGIRSVIRYVQRAAQAVQIAAEAYVFGLSQQRKRAKKLVRGGGTTRLREHLLRDAIVEGIFDDDE